MDFTRQPIIESIITPKEGCRLVVRSSKGLAQEEFFVDSLEVVSFSNFLFYRSLDRPKCFIVPVSDYEVLEVREARMVLKNVGIDKTIKIGGGRVKSDQPAERDKVEPLPIGDEETAFKPRSGESRNGDKKRERRRHGRRRGRGPLRGDEENAAEGVLTEEANEPLPLPHPRVFDDEGERRDAPPPFATILPPPARLISETLERYREDESFRGVFLPRTEVVAPRPVEEEKPVVEEQQQEVVSDE